jgi:hypothetical protein
MPRQLDAATAAQLQPTGDLGRQSNRAGSRDEPSAAPARNLSRASPEREAREKARLVAGSASDAGLATRDAIRTLSVERVSVVDGADRMMYTETRDRKGWRQPLAVQEALRDARRRGAEDGDYAGKGARIVQTFEGEHALQAAIPRVGGPASPTRYALGKASVRANNAGRAPQPQNSARPQQPQTVRETPATRARAR